MNWQQNDNVQFTLAVVLLTFPVPITTNSQKSIVLAQSFGELKFPSLLILACVEAEHQASVSMCQRPLNSEQEEGGKGQESALTCKGSVPGACFLQLSPTSWHHLPTSTACWGPTHWKHEPVGENSVKNILLFSFCDQIDDWKRPKWERFMLAYRKRRDAIHHGAGEARL